MCCCAIITTGVALVVGWSGFAGGDEGGVSSKVDGKRLEVVERVEAGGEGEGGV
jgi:hypothetical protein